MLQGETEQMKNDEDWDDVEEPSFSVKRNIILLISCVLVLSAAVMGIRALKGSKDGSNEVSVTAGSETASVSDEQTESSEMNGAEDSSEGTETADETEELKKAAESTDLQDPQTETDAAANIDVSNVLSANSDEVSGRTIGIDVAKWQGIINWQETAASGVS